MTDEYIDPNSGRAPQPGGFTAAPVVSTDPEDRDVDTDVQDPQDGAPSEQSTEEQLEEWAKGDEDSEDDDESTEQTEEPDASGDADKEESQEDDSKEEPAKDYSELLSNNLPEVQAYLAEHPDEVDAVKAAEIDRAGDDARKGILNYGD